MVGPVYGNFEKVSYATCAGTIDRWFEKLTVVNNSAPILPRKEVIHPQLPLRMPCYDFVPITSPTVIPDLTRGLLVLPALLT